jgi:hypothetical protein
MIRIVLASLGLALAFQQASLTGEWSAVVTAPRGELEYTMYLTQEGPRLTGYFQSQYGEIPLKGSVKGDSITGTATLGSVGQGAFRAERTGS